MAIKKGDIVFVHYTGTLDDGNEFDSSRGRDPLEFVMGGGMIIPGFEAAVEGKNTGNSVSVTIPPEKAYGEHSKEMVLVVPRSELPRHIDPEPGMWLQLETEQGDLDVLISRVTDTEVELDGNHPLAGETLHFAIDIVDVK
jgi:peptidylprolyl isomerase